jgi:hypothetical protein
MVNDIIVMVANVSCLNIFLGMSMFIYLYSLEGRGNIDNHDLYSLEERGNIDNQILLKNKA